MRTLILAYSLFIILFTTIASAEVKVVTSIKPVHSLVSAVMEGAGKPVLLVDGAESPHTYNMKPSEARALKRANLIFWIGEELETFLKKPISSLVKKAKVITLHKVHGLKLLKYREARTWGKGDHHDHHHGDEGGVDMHLWMDIDNAKRIVEETVMVLVSADPANVELYKKNAYLTLQKLDKLEAELKDLLAPVSKKKFIVFHDAYQYFEKYFKLSSAGAVTLNPEVQLGAKHLSELHSYIKSKKISCIFTEPQFNDKIINTLKRRNKLGSAVLDPLGAYLDNGPDLYFQLMRNSASSIANCLGRKGSGNAQ